MTTPYFSSLIPNPNLLTYLTSRHITLGDIIQQTELSHLTIIEMNQVHEATVTYVDHTHTPPAHPDPVPSSDAMITDCQNTALVVRTADCLPILISHPKPMIAAIHAGRKSTELTILEKTIQKMKEKLNKNEKQQPFQIWFGPRICGPCYQIDPVQDIHYDLIAKNKKQLSTILNPSEYELFLDPRCTKCHNDSFYSYRAEGEKSGRIYSIIALTG